MLLISTPLFHYDLKHSLEKTKDEKNNCFHHLVLYIEFWLYAFLLRFKIDVHIKIHKMYNPKCRAQDIFTYVYTRNYHSDQDIKIHSPSERSLMLFPKPYLPPY